MKTESTNPVLGKVKKEFQQHIATAPMAVYQQPAELAQEFGQLARDLETKRQMGSLTDIERKWLKEIDKLLDEISKFNLKTLSVPKKTLDPAIYDMRSGKIITEVETILPPSVPKISEEEADKIIETINEQFAKKVLKKIRKEPQISGENPQDTANFSASVGPVSTGRNLQDYLSAVKAELPNQPFADEDSHIDLGKIRAKQIKHAV